MQMEQDRQTCTAPRENFKNKMSSKYWKSRVLIARLHFSMVIIWRQLHQDFLRFVNWTRPSGLWSNFYEVARGQHPLLSALLTAKSLSCPKSIGSIGVPNILGSTEFKSFKSRWCRTAKLLGAFRRNLKIVSWVTPTPGCTANYPGNRCSQPLILRPFGRSGQELHVECQVEPFSSSFRYLQLKKAVERGQDLGIY